MISRSSEETLHFGFEFAHQLSPGDVIALSGELGAGKTLLARGICRGLGYLGVVTSPSFVRIHLYPHTFSIYHVDFYLVKSEEEIAELGLEELYEGDSIVIVEWAQIYSHLMPKRSKWIEIEWHGKAENVRRITTRC